MKLPNSILSQLLRILEYFANLFLGLVCQEGKTENECIWNVLMKLVPIGEVTERVAEESRGKEEEDGDEDEKCQHKREKREKTATQKKRRRKEEAFPSSSFCSVTSQRRRQLEGGCKGKKRLTKKEGKGAKYGIC